MNVMITAIFPLMNWPPEKKRKLSTLLISRKEHKREMKWQT